MAFALGLVLEPSCQVSQPGSTSTFICLDIRLRTLANNRLQLHYLIQDNEIIMSSPTVHSVQDEKPKVMDIFCTSFNLPQQCYEETRYL